MKRIALVTIGLLAAVAVHAATPPCVQRISAEQFAYGLPGPACWPAVFLSEDEFVAGYNATCIPAVYKRTVSTGLSRHRLWWWLSS